MDYTLGLIFLVLALLGGATAVAYWLRNQAMPGMDAVLLERFYSRLRGWWLLLTLVAAAVCLGTGVTVFLFCCMSFWAMREFITLTPTRQADHKTLFLVFFFCIPLQYIFVACRWYEGYTVFIPVYVFLLIPMMIAAFGDTKRFLERIAKICFGLLICVYCLSFAPALMTLTSAGTVETAKPEEMTPETAAAGQTPVVSDGLPVISATKAAEEDEQKTHAEKEPLKHVSGAGLLCFLLLMTQMAEIFQYLSVHLWPGQHVIAEKINTSKTWEGLITSVLGVMFVGGLVSWATPFPFWLAGLMAAVIAVMSFGGALTLSAIKRDRGVDDYGTLVEGHGGILDRIDTICFAAPIFFHLTLAWL